MANIHFLLHMNAKPPPRCFLVLQLILALCLVAAPLGAQSPVVLQPDIAHPGRQIPDDFCGLSYEIKMVLPHETSLKHYFSPDNAALINTFRTLGVKNLRVGGNTAERVTVAVPRPPDIDSLFAFAKAAGVKVIYTVRLENNTTEEAAQVAKYVMGHYRDLVSCLVVGNEPDKPWKYPEYLSLWKKFTAAILAPDCVPDAKFCGPSARHQCVEFARYFANDMGGWDHLVFISQHYYPRGDGDKITDLAKAREFLLSSAMHDLYQQFSDKFAPAAKAKGADFRIEETNSYGHGGAVGVSDTFTASLWSVDYLYWWAGHDALGLNFHTGQKEMRGVAAPNRPNVYTPLTAVASGIKVLPIGYGMKLFDLGSHGRLVPVAISSNSENLNLVAYATLASDRTLYVTAVNKELSGSGRSARLSVNSGLPGSRGKAIFMSAPDLTAVDGIAIGGAEIGLDGAWDGKWSNLTDIAEDGTVTLILPAASAVVVQLHAK